MQCYAEECLNWTGQGCICEAAQLEPRHVKDDPDLGPLMYPKEDE